MGVSTHGHGHAGESRRSTTATRARAGPSSFRRHVASWPRLPASSARPWGMMDPPPQAHSLVSALHEQGPRRPRTGLCLVGAPVSSHGCGGEARRIRERVTMDSGEATQTSYTARQRPPPDQRAGVRGPVAMGIDWDGLGALVGGNLFDDVDFVATRTQVALESRSGCCPGPSRLLSRRDRSEAGRRCARSREAGELR
jgi:hypothetical protein